MTTRRSLLAGAGAAVAGAVLSATNTTAWGAPAAVAPPAAAQTAKALQDALQASDVVYLTPLHKSGKESLCHAEIWFVQNSGVVYVVTANTAWRAKAIARGVGRARIWAGDFGNWKKADGRFRAAPNYVAKGARVTDPKEIERVLDLYGSKYRVQWLLWSGRFHAGLKDGSRVMLRYTREA